MIDPHRIRALYFDLDGTLAHTLPGLATTVDGVLESLALPKAGPDRVREWIGEGLGRLLEQALAHSCGPSGVPADYPARAMAEFRRVHEHHMLTQSELYPGVKETLESLREQSIPMACITNKLQEFTLPLLESLGIGGYFEVVLCGDSLPQRKPDPEPLLETGRRMGISPGQAIMVGDSVNDTMAARRAGVPVAVVAYGYHKANHASELEADLVLETFGELLDVLRPDVQAKA